MPQRGRRAGRHQKIATRPKGLDNETPRGRVSRRCRPCSRERVGANVRDRAHQLMRIDRRIGLAQVGLENRIGSAIHQMCPFRFATDRRQTSPAKSWSSEPHLNLSLLQPDPAVRVIRGSIQRSGLRTPSGSGGLSIDRRRSSSRAGPLRAQRRGRGGRRERARFARLSAPPVESTPCPGGRSR